MKRLSILSAKMKVRKFIAAIFLLSKEKGQDKDRKAIPGNIYSIS